MKRVSKYYETRFIYLQEYFHLPKYSGLCHKLSSLCGLHRLACQMTQISYRNHHFPRVTAENAV